MRKRNSSRASSAAVSNPSGARPAGDAGVTTGYELFNFPNGDRYEGGFGINAERSCLVRQGRGIYYTDDFDSYEATWEKDKIAGDLRVRFNNGMEYKGDLDKDGKFGGPGSYRYPDGSSIEATWKENKPDVDIRYKEPLGYIWKGEISEDGDAVRFTAGNHFWDDMNVVTQDSKSEEQSVAEIPTNSQSVQKL